MGYQIPEATGTQNMVLHIILIRQHTFWKTETGEHYMSERALISQTCSDPKVIWKKPCWMYYELCCNTQNMENVTPICPFD